MAWPFDLSPWYSHPAVDGIPLPAWLIVASAGSLLAITMLAVQQRERRPYLTVGWLWYLGTLVPVIGVVQVGLHGMADRYTYVPLIGIVVALVWWAGEWPLWRTPRRVPAIAVVLIALVGLVVLTRRQIAVWHDSATFWRYTLRVNPRAGMAHFKLAAVLRSEQRTDEAIIELRRAAKLLPTYVYAHTGAGELLATQGRFAAAANHFRKAIDLAPEGAEHHSNLANVLLRQGRPDAARRHLEIALALRPGFAEAHNNLAIVLAEEGEVSAAIAHFRAALAAKPDFAAARANLAAVLQLHPELASDPSDPSVRSR
jgi:Flp pilus assembly protein TadD